MRKKYFLSLAALIAVVLSGFTAVPFKSQGEDDLERKIVVFKNGLSGEEKDELIKKHGGLKVKELDLIKGKAVLIDKKGGKELEKNKNVLRVDDDIIVEALDKRSVKIGGSGPSQIIPWGISKIHADKVWTLTVADTVKVAVIDTGIELSHPDLKLNIKGGYNAIRPGRSPNDDNGHGTHVAGIIAAVNNNIGVVGVAPAADLYAVKSLSKSGSGFLSDIIEGIDWAIQNKMQVINMSLGTRSDIQSFHDAVIRANNAGIVVVAAAGNDFGGAVNFPAGYPEVIAVSATTLGDQIASFSSVGPEVDFAAPGENIFSSYRGQTYKILSGTSMASPHVAGAAALTMSITEKCDTDFDGVCSPLEVKQRMELTAMDLGILGFDNSYGSGLINAETAVTQ